jgi:excisionase family DNA binding protein
MSDLPDLLTVSQAATVAGVSARTMRRWVGNGQVRSVGSGHGRRVVAAALSELPVTNGQAGQPGRARSVTGSVSVADVAEAGHLADLVRQLTDRLAEQSAVAAMWQERARVLAERLALAAPESPESPLTAPGAPESPNLTPGPPPAPEPVTGPCREQNLRTHMGWRDHDPRGRHGQAEAAPW